MLFNEWQLPSSSFLLIFPSHLTTTTTPLCFPQIMTAVLTTRSTPLILAGMAVERYISICFPLHYSQMCTVPRTLLLICVILILTATPPISDLLITIVNEPLSFFHTTIFCDHPLLFRQRSIYYKNCVFDGVYLSCVALTLLYTYCRIMLTARAASTGLASVNRARNTVMLHGVQVCASTHKSTWAMADHYIATR